MLRLKNVAPFTVFCRRARMLTG